MCNAYFEERSLIPEGNLIEIKYEELVKDPFKHTELVYKELGLQGFAEFAPKLQKYVATLKNYETNKHSDIPEGVRAKIAREAKVCFDNWGYSTKIE